jgi:hypothetical protein
MAYQPIRTLTAQARAATIGSRHGGWWMNGEINVVALVRGEEQYIFMFDEANRTETLRMLGRYAADPELSFSWYDAAVLSQKVRELLPAKKQNAMKSASSGASADGLLDESPTKAMKPAPRFKLY